VHLLTFGKAALKACEKIAAASIVMAGPDPAIQ
jgi:hypothetical protein